MISFKDFEMDQSILAKTIYKNYPHKTTSIGLVIAMSVILELKSFLQGFLEFHNRPEVGRFIRVDTFFSEKGLQIIELNVELADGWGVALNLARASGNSVVVPANTSLPSRYIAYTSNYLPEYELAIDEFRQLGYNGIAIESRYYETEVKDELDNKLCLERFARKWKGCSVKVPNMYSIETTPWEELPTEVVFKFAEKYGEEAIRAHYSVKPRDGIGKGEYMRKIYRRGRAVAQERILPSVLADGSVTQAIIMLSGSTPITGYLQVAPSTEFIINDRTAVKGPLLFI